MEGVNLKELEVVIFLIMGSVVLLISSVLFFALTYSKKQRQNKAEKEILKQKFESEKLASKLETTEQTMKEISQELHDNLGQKLTLAIQRTRKELGDNHELDLMLCETLDDLRQISKSMNGSYLEKLGIDLAIEKECKRVNDSTEIKCEYFPTEKSLSLKPEQEIILFRCFQELVNNSVKYSKASNLEVTLERSEDSVILTVNDNGIGFETENVESGVGMISLKNRIELLNGIFALNSSANNGTKAKIRIPVENTVKDDINSHSG